MPSPRVSDAGTHVGALREILARCSGGKLGGSVEIPWRMMRVKPTSARTSRSFSTSTIFSKYFVKSSGGSTAPQLERAALFGLRRDWKRPSIPATSSRRGSSELSLAALSASSESPPKSGRRCTWLKSFSWPISRKAFSTSRLVALSSTAQLSSTKLRPDRPSPAARTGPRSSPGTRDSTHLAASASHGLDRSRWDRRPAGAVVGLGRQASFSLIVGTERLSPCGDGRRTRRTSLPRRTLRRSPRLRTGAAGLCSPSCP